jgi:peptidoglycan/xylan/chitin deacetylase (PgdA/CDA1 family)
VVTTKNNKHFLFTCDVENVGPGTEKGVHKFLELLSGYNLIGTFFVTYRILNDYPNIVEEIVKCGHEIASHGYSHPYLERDYLYLNSLPKEQIEKEINLSFNKFHEKGINVKGFRAPAFKINEYTLDCIRKWFEYDSSSVNFLFRTGRNAGLYKKIYSDEKTTFIPVTSIGKLRVPFGSPYFLAFGSKTGNIIQKNLLKNGVAVFYCHCYDLIKVNPEFKAAKKIIPQLVYLNLCGTKRAYQFYQTLLSTALDLGYHFITCSELTELLKNGDTT